MLNKLSIEDDLKVDHSEGKLCNIIKRLQLNIPQVSSYLYLSSIQLNGLLAVYTRDRWSGRGVLEIPFFLFQFSIFNPIQIVL